MKRVPACLLLWLSASLLAAATAPSLKDLERVRLPGGDYVRLFEWGEAFGFSVRWTRKDEELAATNRVWTLRFTADSRRAQINDVNVMLSLPVVPRNGVPFISLADLQTTIHPVLAPPKNTASQKIKTVCLDPGHGGRDPGNMEQRIQEKKYTLLLAEETARLLKQSGFRVVTTRSRDQFMELSSRARTANRHGADLFVSLHFNSAANPAVKGVEVYCLTPAGLGSSNSGGGATRDGACPGNTQDARNIHFAWQMQRALLKNLGFEDRGVKRARFEVLREARMPSVLVEAGFMSNSSEAARIYDATFRKRTALAIVDGILGYKRAVEN